MEPKGREVVASACPGRRMLLHEDVSGPSRISPSPRDPTPFSTFLEKNTINYRCLFLPVLKAGKLKIMVPADPVFGERHDSLGDPCVRWQVLGHMILDHSEQGPGEGLMVPMNPISFLPNIVSMCLLLNFVKRGLEMMAGSKDFSRPPKGQEPLERTENV